MSVQAGGGDGASGQGGPSGSAAAASSSGAPTMDASALLDSFSFPSTSDWTQQAPSDQTGGGSGAPAPSPPAAPAADPASQTAGASAAKKSRATNTDGTPKAKKPKKPRASGEGGDGGGGEESANQDAERRDSVAAGRDGVGQAKAKAKAKGRQGSKAAAASSAAKGVHSRAGSVTESVRQSAAPESRAGSVKPGAAVGGGGETTPTRRGGRGGGRGRGRGSRGGGRRGGTARAESRASRATSALGGRASASVIPGAGGEDDDGRGPSRAGGGGQGGDGAADGEYDEGEEEGDVEDDDDDDAQADEGLKEDELDRQEAIQRQRSMNMGPLMKAMDPEQQERYSAFRRFYLDKRHVRRIVSHLTAQAPTPQVTTLVAGVGKVFVGEIVERARHIQRAEQERRKASSPDEAAASAAAQERQQPLRPEHLAEAFRLYRQEREVPGCFPPGAPQPGAGAGANGKRRRLF